MDKLFSTLVEVIDPGQGRVVARHSFDRYVVNALPDAGVVLYHTDTAGERRTVVLRLAVAGQ